MQRKDSKWQPGASGNPKGRPRGTGKIEELRESLGNHVPEVIAALVKKSKSGDVGAMRLLLERTIPALRAIDTATPIELGGNLMTACRSILAAIETGDITPTQASTLLQAVGTAARVEEIAELKKRLEAIESAIIKR